MILVTQHSRGTPFDNATNSFTSTEAQSAIEEARDAATGKIQYLVSINRNGVMSNGDWFGRNEVMPNSASYVANRAITLIGISWSNSKADRDFDLEFYKNGRTTTKFRTYEARNLTLGYDFGWTDSFSAGDYLDIKYIDQGDNASDMGLDIYWSVQ